MRKIYDEARQQGQQILSNAILRIAEGILRTEGPAGLSMRQIASEAGCSTMVLYNLFKSKEGLIEALYVEGFQRLRSAIEATLSAQSADSIQNLLALCDSYRQMALANPIHYGIMFGNVIPTYRPSPDNLALALEVVQPLVAVVTTARDKGQLSTADPTEFAMMLWSVAHGFVSLELAGYYHLVAVPENMYHEMLMRVLRS